MGGVVKTLSLIFVVLPIKLFAANCDMAEICKAVKGLGPVPDRVSNGRVIKGGKPSAFNLKSSNYELKDAGRIRALVKDAKSRFPKIIGGGRSADKLTVAEKALITSLTDPAIQLVEPDNNIDCMMACVDEGFAFAIYEQKKVCVCPLAEAYPDEFLMYAIGHELGHFGDVCSVRSMGLKPGQHPFEQETSGGSVIACLTQNGISEPPEKKAKPGCNPLNPTIMWEASADALGFAVQTDFMKDHPFERNEPANFWRAFGIFLEFGCEKSPGAWDGSTRRHLSMMDRIEKIGLPLPSMRAALGCKDPSPLQNCEYRSAVQATTMAVPQNSPPTER